MKTKWTLYLFLVLLVASVVLAQQAAQTGPLTNQRIIELVHSGVRSDELARIIATAPQVSFDLSPAATSSMMQAGVSEDTIKAMAAKESGISPNASAQQNTVRPEVPASGGEWGEKPPSGDIFAGYSYLNFETNGLTTSRQNANGWESSVAFSANRWLAAEATSAGITKHTLP